MIARTTPFLSATVAFMTPFLPAPVDSLSIVALVGSLLAIIAVGHRSAFRQNPHGIFAQWTNPKCFAAMALSGSERQTVLISAAVIAGSLIGIVVRNSAIG